MDEKNILEVITKRCNNKENKRYLECSEAYKIAEELNVNVSVIGRVCNENSVKIKGCQLGCF